MTATDTTADRYQWGPAPEWMRRWDPKPTLIAEAADGARLEFYIKVTDGDVEAVFVVHTPSRDVYSTESAQDWPMVEVYIPRAEWPEAMFAGKRHAGPRRPDSAIASAVQAEWDTCQALLAEED